MYYIIQENIFKEHHYDLLFDAMNRMHLHYEVVRIFPFVNKIVNVDQIPKGSFNVDDLPDYKPDFSNLFVFGAIKLAQIAKKQNWFPGSFMNENHDFEVYSKYYKENLLNYDSEVKTIGDVLQWRTDELKFIRPTEDTKSFTGKVFTEQEWNDTMENYLHNYRSERFNEHTKIQVSTPKNIYKEIRCWVVKGKVITWSQYRLGNQVIYDDVVEDEAIAYAQKMVDVFQLADGFVIDVCLTSEGWRIVECGCINAAGFYKANLPKLVMALEDNFSL